jgi:hypothetical protein
MNPAKNGAGTEKWRIPVSSIGQSSSRIADGLGEEDALVGTKLELLRGIGLIAVVEPGG